MAVDQVGNAVNATIHSSVVSEGGVNRLKEEQAEQKVGNQCTELEYNVFSKLHSDGTLCRGSMHQFGNFKKTC